mgnify:CR=1 FL=1|tara:strand:+ start:445 stop:2433 length:1989 start_codon:yes stop_codon:yes gene_type:complete
MAEFSWAYIDAVSGVSASGPTGSIQYRVGDSGNQTSVSGSSNFIFHTASNLLAITGSVEISGTLTANQYNINVVDKTVTNLSASGDTIFGDTADDTHQFTGSVFITGSGTNKTTVIDGTHLSSSVNISGSKIYAASDFHGDIVVSRYVTHNGDADTYLDFTDDKLEFTIGNRKFLTLTEDSTDTFVINRLEGPVNTTINSDNGDVLNASTAGIVINDSGMPGHDFRVESNQKQNAIYLDSDLQYVHLLADGASPAGGLGTDMCLFVSGTVGSRGTGTRGTAVFGGDVVITGSLFAGNLTGSKGALFNDRVMIIDDKSLVLGSGGDSVIKYDEAGSDNLVVSGSAVGLMLMGATINVNSPSLLASNTDIIVTGSIIITGSALNTTTAINGTHVSSSLNISGSSFYGDGTNLTGVIKEAAGSTGQIQFNNSDAFGASDKATLSVAPSAAALIITGSSTTVGSVQAISGSTQVFGVDSSVTGLGGVRGRMVQHIRTGFTLENGATAATGRYVSIGGNAVAVSATPSNVNCMITPFSGRLISIMYHMPAAAGKQDPSKGQPQWQLRVGNVNELKGQTFGNALTNVGQITASSWPGTNIVGGVDIQTKVGSLHGNNITGSFSFGTGSVVALFFKSGDGSNNNYPGAASFTTVWEFDQLSPYITGSGN